MYTLMCAPMIASFMSLYRYGVLSRIIVMDENAGSTPARDARLKGVKMPGTLYEQKRGLILIYKSHNAHYNVNYIMTNVADMEKFTSHPEAKKELVDTLHQLAKAIEEHY